MFRSGHSQTVKTNEAVVKKILFASLLKQCSSLSILTSVPETNFNYNPS